MTPGITLTDRNCETCGVPLSRETEQQYDGDWYCKLCYPPKYQ